jgi:hypothetical protein
LLLRSGVVALHEFKEGAKAMSLGFTPNELEIIFKVLCREDEPKQGFGNLTVSAVFDEKEDTTPKSFSFKKFVRIFNQYKNKSLSVRNLQIFI